MRNIKAILPIVAALFAFACTDPDPRLASHAMTCVDQLELFSDAHTLAEVPLCREASQELEARAMISSQLAGRDMSPVIMSEFAEEHAAAQSVRHRSMVDASSFDLTCDFTQIRGEDKLGRVTMSQLGAVVSRLTLEYEVGDGHGNLQRATYMPTGMATQWNENYVWTEYAGEQVLASAQRTSPSGAIEWERIYQYRENTGTPLVDTVQYRTPMGLIWTRNYSYEERDGNTFLHEVEQRNAAGTVDWARHYLYVHDGDRWVVSEVSQTAGAMAKQWTRTYRYTSADANSMLQEIEYNGMVSGMSWRRTLEYDQTDIDNPRLLRAAYHQPIMIERAVRSFEYGDTAIGDDVLTRLTEYDTTMGMMWTRSLEY